MSETLFLGDTLSLVAHEQGIAEIVLDRREDSVNKLDGQVISELDQALDRLASVPGVRGVLVSSAKDAFLAGADISVLWAMLGWSPERLQSFCLDMDRTLTRLEDLPVPVVCAVSGYALGGGFEFALAADYRVLATGTLTGFPEVSLGILPAAGGTVRTPRLAGAAAAVEWVVGARNQKADAALKVGLADRIVAQEQLRNEALLLLQSAIDGGLDWRQRRDKRRGTVEFDLPTFSAAREQARRSSRHQPAALAVVDLLESTASLTRDAAFQFEAQAFSKLMKTPAARALVGIFLSSQQLKKKTRSQSGNSRPLKKAGVVGAGIMGGGVAYTTAVRGLPVLMKDITQPALDLGMGEARKLLAKQVETGRMAQPKADAILSSIVPTLDYSDFQSVDIVVEAVVENLKVKQEVFAAIEAHTKPGTVLASNTSSLAVADIAANLERPQNVVGMHFFNPVHVMPLVEVVKTASASPEAIATTVAYANAMGKVPLVVKDCAGFLVNRILGAYFTSFLQLIRDGADFVQVDRVLESWGWPMGPSYLMDVAGVDTLEKALAILGKAYPTVMGTDFITAVQVLASQKRFGQKTGAGFYRYEADAKGKPRRSGDPTTYELLAGVQPRGNHQFSDEVILDRMMLAMILEAGRCLDEEVADGPIEVDAGMRLGTGFPTHHGGPLWYADMLGLSEVLRRCEQYRDLGGLFEPGAGFKALAAKGLPIFNGFAS
jgi:3-hydroxyacyl-CoA dehydrogenase/enoyl-CoA hydratase/3-hydroxybutyryl-CoA epimerase/enoyl-CoA isomerase